MFYFSVLLSKRSITPAGGKALENTPGAESLIIVCPNCLMFQVCARICITFGCQTR